MKVRFWFPADMAAQCGVFGHGCAGKHYCAHCMANEDERHELFIALLGAVDAEDLEVQQQLLNAHPDLLTMSDLEGRTALHRAAGRGVALSLTHLISVSPDLGIANVSVS